MKFTVRQNRIELEAESHLEDDIIKEWVKKKATVTSGGSKHSYDRWIERLTINFSDDVQKNNPN